MNKTTLKALKGSIKKWELIVSGVGEDLGDENCPLCKRFAHKENTCAGCPVAEKAGRFCERTPYIPWTNYVGGYGAKADTPKKKLLARAELKFLKSLLP